ncbi:MAG TPA: hypothetical protein PK447_02830 [Ignavibacteria bacterium]|nr:hypothetical protein [Ignavibacteria bacterium]
MTGQESRENKMGYQPDYYLNGNVTTTVKEIPKHRQRYVKLYLINNGKYFVFKIYFFVIYYFSNE